MAAGQQEEELKENPVSQFPLVHNKRILSPPCHSCADLRAGCLMCLM